MASLALLCTLLLISLAYSHPISTDIDTASKSTSSNSVSSYDDTLVEEKGTDEKEDSKSTASTATEATTSSHEHEDNNDSPPEFCNKTTYFTITYLDHTLDTKGNPMSYNKTIKIPTVACCKGYEKINGSCRRRPDLCKGMTCADPSSKCVTVKRCGQLLPVFINSTGIISTTCTQPQVTQDHLNECPGAIGECSAHSQCARKERDEPMVVCFDTKCDDNCKPEAVWLKLSGDQKDCY